MSAPSSERGPGLYPDIPNEEATDIPPKNIPDDASSENSVDASNRSYPAASPSAPPVEIHQSSPEDPAPGYPYPPETVSLNIDSTDQQDDKPPPYHSDPPPPYSPAQIKYTIKTAKEESSGNVDFARRVVFGVCCGTVCCGILIVLHLVIPISMIAIGSIYLHDCPRQRYIPIYLVVGGCFGVVKAIVNTVDQVRGAVTTKRRQKAGQDTRESSRKPNPADGIVSCFLGAWFIAGCYWIYSTHKDFQWTEPEADDYCNYTLYYYAFWLTTASFILLACSCCCCCALGIAMCVMTKKQM